MSKDAKNSSVISFAAAARRRRAQAQAEPDVEDFHYLLENANKTADLFFKGDFIAGLRRLVGASNRDFYASKFKNQEKSVVTTLQAGLDVYVPPGLWKIYVASFEEHLRLTNMQEFLRLHRLVGHGTIDHLTGNSPPEEERVSEVFGHAFIRELEKFQNFEQNFAANIPAVQVTPKLCRAVGSQSGSEYIMPSAVLSLGHDATNGILAYLSDYLARHKHSPDFHQEP